MRQHVIYLTKGENIVDLIGKFPSSGTLTIESDGGNVSLRIGGRQIDMIHLEKNQNEYELGQKWLSVLVLMRCFRQCRPRITSPVPAVMVLRFKPPHCPAESLLCAFIEKCKDRHYGQYFCQNQNGYTVITPETLTAYKPHKYDKEILELLLREEFISLRPGRNMICRLADFIKRLHVTCTAETIISVHANDQKLMELTAFPGENKLDIPIPLIALPFAEVFVDVGDGATSCTLEYMTVDPRSELKLQRPSKIVSSGGVCYVRDGVACAAP